MVVFGTGLSDGLGIVGFWMGLVGHLGTDGRSRTESIGKKPYLSRRRKSPKRAKEIAILWQITALAPNIFFPFASLGGAMPGSGRSRTH
jgi:hypothetical protein